MDTRLFSIREAASRLGLHHQTVKRYIRDGKLSHVRIAENNIRISEAQLARFVAAHTVRATR